MKHLTAGNATLAQTILCREPPAQSLYSQVAAACAWVANAADRADRYGVLCGAAGPRANCRIPTRATITRQRVINPNGLRIGGSPVRERLPFQMVVRSNVLRLPFPEDPVKRACVTVARKRLYREAPPR